MHAHAHDHRESHDSGSHRPRSRDDRRRLTIVLVLSTTYMFAEAAGGLITGSLALLADAGHLLSDVVPP